MLVKDIMNTKIVSISPDEPASFASRLLGRHNIGSLPVCTADGHLKGIITDRDIVLRCVASESDPSTTPVKEIMSRSVLTASPNDDVSRLCEIMSTAQIRRVPVVEHEKLVGIVALGDMAKEPVCDMEAAKALTDISSNLRKR